MATPYRSEMGRKQILLKHLSESQQRAINNSSLKDYCTPMEIGCTNSVAKQLAKKGVFIVTVDDDVLKYKLRRPVYE